MTNPAHQHTLSFEDLYQLLLYQMNQFELFKSFIINILDSKNIIEVGEFHELFEEFKNVNGTKLLNNLILMNPKLEDVRIDISISR